MSYRRAEVTVRVRQRAWDRFVVEGDFGETDELSLGRLERFVRGLLRLRPRAIVLAPHASIGPYHPAVGRPAFACLGLRGEVWAAAPDARDLVDTFLWRAL